jgi:Protein of unknown function (DUF3047)
MFGPFVYGKSVTKHAIVLETPASRHPRGFLKKLLLLCAILAFVFQARTSQMAVIVLSAANMAPDRPPSDWQVKVNHGKPEISGCNDGDGPCVHLRSVKSSFSLERGVDVDPLSTPYLAWTWKVTQLPPSGDFRKSSTDDQAAQVLVAFADRRVLTYIWDSNAPKGTVQSASSIPLVHVFAVVAESGGAQANRWVPELHNVEADYERAFGKPAPHVKGLRLQINSQHTGATAESYFGEVAFRSTAR